MLRRDELTDQRWRRLHESLDAAVADAAWRYLRELTVRGVSISPSRWVEELAELRLGREPDYELPGFPLVYALRYMPRRVVSVLGLLLVNTDGREPRNVLDVGSGTGAAVALDLLEPNGAVDVVGLEPSSEMASFAEQLSLRARVSLRHERGSLRDILSGYRDTGVPDLLVFSAPFPYGFDEADALAEALGDYECHSELMVVVEPVAKSDLLDTFSRRLRAQGWPIRRFRGRDLPRLLTANDLPLNRLTRVWRRLGSPSSLAPRTWWDPPDDRLLVANPRPDWPELSPAIGHLPAARRIGDKASAGSTSVGVLMELGLVEQLV